MKFVPYDKNNLERMSYKKTRNQVFLTEFMNGDADCVMITEHHYKDAYVCATTLRRSAERFHMNIKVVTSKGTVYLIKQ